MAEAASFRGSVSLERLTYTFSMSELIDVTASADSQEGPVLQGLIVPDPAPTPSPVAAAPVPAEPQPRSIEITLSGPLALLNNRFAVFALLCVAGPLGLPALWFSPRFSRVTKTAVSLVFFGLTAVLPLVGAWYALEWLIRPIADALNAANGS